MITAMNNIGEASIGFEDSTEEPIDPRAELRGGADPEDPREATETAEQDWEEALDSYGDLEVEEVNGAIRVLEEADYQANAEEERDYINTRATVNQERFQTEHEADRYTEYVAMGWREPESLRTSGKWFSTAVTAELKLTSSEPELFYARHICPVMLERWPRWSRPTSTLIKR